MTGPVSDDELAKRMAEIEKVQQLAGHFPDDEALDRARRILTGDITADEAFVEIERKRAARGHIDALAPHRREVAVQAALHRAVVEKLLVDRDGVRTTARRNLDRMRQRATDQRATDRVGVDRRMGGPDRRARRRHRRYVRTHRRPRDRHAPNGTLRRRAHSRRTTRSDQPCCKSARRRSDSGLTDQVRDRLWRRGQDAPPAARPHPAWRQADLPT